MNPREEGFLLLSSHLGVPDRKVLTQAQLRQLSRRIAGAEAPVEDRELETQDLTRLGYGADMAARILGLLKEEEILRHYLHRGRQSGCVPLTRVSDSYPQILRKRLGPDSPGCLWMKGDASLLGRPGIALVGSRELEPRNRAFAEAVGKQAARRGLTLISGNARGADKTAQEACLRHGGSVISIVADRLDQHRERERVLYISEDGFDLPFSAQRALSRNRVIHCWGELAFVAQSRLGMGGTWDGTVQNLRSGWSTVVCFRDGSDAMAALEAQGAYLADIPELEDMTAFTSPQEDLFHRL